MINVELYINDEKVDLYSDEKININLGIKNYQQLDKVVTDFSQSFTIPASGKNNRILEHWYNRAITTSFNPATKLTARIELNNLPFRNGVVTLNKAVIKGGKVEFYDVAFFGGTSNLTQLFGEDYLNQLDLSAYNVDWDDFDDAIADTVQSGNVLIPLISPSRNWQYNTHTDDDSIAFVSTASTGISYSEMKPAIRLIKILDAIEAKYSITFNSTFLNSTDFAKLYMWAHREAGVNKNFGGAYQDFIPDAQGDPPVPAADYYDIGNEWFYYSSTSTSATLNYDLIFSQPNDNYEDIPVEVIIYDLNNSNAIIEKRILPSTDIYNERFVITRPSSGQMNFRFAFRAATLEEYDVLIISDSFITWTQDSYYMDVVDFAFTDQTATDGITGETLSYKGNLPNQTVTEFLGGLVNMFNLVIEPVSDTEFNIEPLNDYYAAGATLSLSDYVDVSNQTITPASLYGEIEFKYKETKTILSDNFRETNDIGYGDLKTKIVDASGDPISSNTFKIELPFINMLFERLIDQTDSNALSSILVAKYIDKSLKPIIEKPYIFYYAGQQSISSTPIGIKRANGVNTVTLTTNNLVYQFNTKTSAYTNSLNFGTEINPLSLTDSGATAPTLFNEYWKTYISGLYNISQRKYEFQGVLPLGVLIGLRLNSPVIIGYETYRINTIKVDLTTGEAQLDLISIVE